MQFQTPFLFMLLIAFADTFNTTYSPNSGTKNFLVCKLGLKILLVLILEWETLFPTIAFFPVIWQTLDISLFFMITSFKFGLQKYN